MNELAAQCSQNIEKIVNAARSIQEKVICGICLELFNEPVTIRCGHRFCRSCILRVTDSKNSACPFCKIKIRKRSIPTEGNKLFQLVVKQFLTLTKAIKEDSGIDVLEPSTRPTNTKESVPLNDKPCTSKFEQSSNISKGSSSQTNQKSTHSKIKSQIAKKNDVTKKLVKTNSIDKRNTLHKYLSNNFDNVPNQEVQSEDKVKSWLSNITSHVDDVGSSDSINEDGSPFLKTVKEKYKVPEVLESTQVFEKVESPRCKNDFSSKNVKETDVDDGVDDSVSTKDEELKYKETQSRIQELEMIARRKKLNLNHSDKTTLKTLNVPTATPCSDWRRIKKVGKEMQGNTFKSLNISVEKSSSSGAVDDNVPSTSSAVHDNRTRQKISKVNDDSCQREIPKLNNYSMDTTGSSKAEHFSMPCIDEDQVNDIIGILPKQNHACTSEKTRNISRVSSKECVSKLEISSPLARSTTKAYEIDSDDNIQNSPAIRKLSLKKNGTNSNNAKLTNSQSGTSDETKKSENNSPRKLSSERPKSRLSLCLPSKKTSDQHVKPSETVVLNSNDIKSSITFHNLHSKKSDKDKKFALSHEPRISFKKLGKICKKRKNVPFVQLGKLRTRIKVLVKSDVPVNFDIKSLELNKSSTSSKVNNDKPDNKEIKILSPEKDSQLKYLSIESPHHKRGVSKIINETENVNKSTFETTYQDQSHALMEVDPIPVAPESHILMADDIASSDLQENNSTINEKLYVKKNEDTNYCGKISKHSDEGSTKNNLQKGLIKASISKNYTETETLTKITTSNSSSSTDSESSEDDNDSDYSESNQNSSPAKEKENEDEQDVVSTSLKDNDKFTKNFKAQKVVENKKGDLTEDETSLHSEAESNPDSKNRCILSSAKETNKYSEVESNEDSDISDAKTRSKSKKSNSSDISDAKTGSKSKKSNSNSVNTRSSVIERNKVFEVESNTDSDTPEIRHRIKKTNCRVQKSFILDPVTKLNETLQHNSKETDSSNASTPSSIKRISKKKRRHSDSSNDDEDFDVTSIIGKWFGNTDIPVTKKAKVDPSTQNNLISNQNKTKSIFLEDDNDDDMDVTLVSKENQLQPKALQKGPPIDDITSKVKNLQESSLGVSKLVTIPSSLMSADLFESNEPCIQPSAQISPKQVAREVIDDKNEDVLNTTLVDLMQTCKKKSNMSESSDGSNKENRKSNQISLTIIAEVHEDKKHEIEKSKITNNLNSSQTDTYQISESLMNITQEQLALKRIEKDLIGIDLSTVHDDKKKIVEDSHKYCTPKGKKNQIPKINEVNEDENFDPDNIDGTPCARKSRKSIRDVLPNQLLSKFNEGSQTNSSEIFSPMNNAVNLIPAVTPVKNTTSYPLCHSTPLINTSNSESQSAQTKIVLVGSGLQPDQIKTMQAFAKRFHGKFQTTFSMDVTHVIILTDPETKIGQRTFKYIQGIAFQKHVLNFQWIVDCLNKNEILNEEDEKYEVLDSDVFESGAKKSRNRQQGLFEIFAVFCLEPFNDVSITDFKNILAFNGAVVVDSLAQLAVQKDKLKIIIISEDFDLDQKKENAFKKVQCALVSYEWVIDSISQYHALSLAPYLQKTSAEDLLAWGFPNEYLAEEEFGDEEDEEDELE